MSFNGATSFRTWKSYAGFAPANVTTPLQWSHILSDVEICQTFPPGVWKEFRFNGATSFRTWKLERIKTE